MTKYDRAMQIWVLLACAAKDRTLYTYHGLGWRLGMKKAAGVMAQFLGPIMRYCEHHGLPPLTILVINQASGQPGDGLITVDPDKAGDARKKVFEYDWLNEPPPQVKDLEEAVRRGGSA